MANKFSKPYIAYLGKDTVYNFTNNIIKESKYYSEVMKNHFNRELMMNIEDNEDFKNSAKCWIRDNVLLITMLK